MLRKFILASLLLLPNLALAQDTAVRYQSQVIGSRGLPLANQSVAVCTQPAVTTTQPCSPLATLATSTSTSSGGTNPLTTDVNGNFFFYAVPGKYTIQIYGPQVGTPFVQPDTVLGISAVSNTVVIKPAAASAFRYVDTLGSDSNDGLTLASAYATPQKCNTVVVALGGGTCDARTLYNYTTTTEIDVGNSSAVPVSLLLPPTGIWTTTSTIAGNMLKVFNASSVISQFSGLGSPFAIIAASGANVTDVCGTSSAGPVGYVKIQGFACHANSGATVSVASCEWQNLADQSSITGMQCGNFSGTKGLYVHNACCQVFIQSAQGTNGAVGGVPCTFGSLADALIGTIIQANCTNPGTGQPVVSIVQGSQNHYGLYIEASATDLATAAVQVTSTSTSNPDFIDYVIKGANVGGETRYTVDLAANTAMILRNISTGTSGNTVNDHNTGRSTISLGVNSVLSYYDSTFGSQVFSNYFPTIAVGGPIKNILGTATMGMTLKKGTGAGNYTSASTTYVVVDSTNLCFSAVIPTGWKLSIDASGNFGTATAPVVANVALTDNAACGTANAGILVEQTETSTAAGVLEPFSMNWVITGDGATHNIALQYKTSAGADVATILNSSSTQLPAMVFTLMPSN